MAMDVGENINELLQSLIAAVGGPNWASVILLVIMLLVLVGGGFLVYRRMESHERLLNQLLLMIATFLSPGKPPDKKE